MGSTPEMAGYRMKLLVYGINYYPESIGIGKYTADMCEWFAQRGHTVHVITAMPYYPQWAVHKAYQGRLWHTETIKGVKVFRCPLYVPSTVSGISRVLHEATFAVSSSLFWIRCLFRRYDAVISIAPPLQTGLAGWLYSLFRRTLTVYHVQDLQLDAARKLGLLKGRLLLAVAEWLEKFILRRSDFVSTISQGMKKVIVGKGVSEARMIDLLNWIDTTTFQPRRPDPEIRRKFELSADDKVILYSGNLGEKQGLDIVPEVAERLKDGRIVFIIIGEGAYKERLESELRKKSLSNVRLFPLQPYDQLPGILAMADLHLVLQKKAAADLVMPSKLTAILAMGGCALVTAEKGTFLHDVVVENQLAVIVEPENPIALSIAITTSLGSDNTIIRRSARAYAETQLEKERILTRFEGFLLTQTLNR